MWFPPRGNMLLHRYNIKTCNNKSSPLLLYQAFKIECSAALTSGWMMAHRFGPQSPNFPATYVVQLSLQQVSTLVSILFYSHKVLMTEFSTYNFVTNRRDACKICTDRQRDSMFSLSVCKQPDVSSCLMNTSVYLRITVGSKFTCCLCKTKYTCNQNRKATSVGVAPKII